MSPKNVFCLGERRLVNAYRRISLFDQESQVPNLPLREQVQVHLVPHIDTQLLELRLWWKKRVPSLSSPQEGIRVHFSGSPATTCCWMKRGSGPGRSKYRSLIRRDLRVPIARGYGAESERMNGDQ
jgi:hypothetical protein